MGFVITLEQGAVDESEGPQPRLGIWDSRINTSDEKWSMFEQDTSKCVSVEGDATAATELRIDIPS